MQSIPSGEESAVRSQSEAYIHTFNQKDPNTLIHFWADEAIYKNPISGHLVQGKESIKKEFQEMFDQLQGAAVAQEIESITFSFDDKAVEQGKMRILRAGKPLVESDYQIIYVKRNGEWLILSASGIDLSALSN